MASETEQLPPLHMMAQLTEAIAADAERLRDAFINNKRIGPVTGLSRLDAAIGQALQTGVHVLHGSPGSGKSALAWQIAGRCECPALFVSCEMSPLEMFKRHIARETETYLGKLKSGELPPSRVLALAENAAAKTPLLALMDATTRPARTPHIYKTAELLRETHSKDGHLLIVIDSLHSWASKVNPDVEEYERLTNACDGLCELAQKLKCAVLVVSERNRSSMKNDGQNSGAGSRRIEYSAETVFGLDAEKEKVGDERLVSLNIGKNRNGPADIKVNLVFNGGFQKFTEAPF